MKSWVRGLEFQSPRGDFGFLKLLTILSRAREVTAMFQSPRGDFGFLKPVLRKHRVGLLGNIAVSIPSRGFWFFEG